MRVLITSGSSYIGQYLTRNLLRLNHDVHYTYCKSTPCFEAPDGSNGATGYRVDFRRPEDFDQLPLEFDAVVNNFGVSTGWELENFEVGVINALGGANFGRFIAKIKCDTVINLSTLSVYGSILDKKLHASSPFNSPCIYGASKYLEEVFLDSVARDLKRLTHIRLPVVLGAGAHRAFIPKIIENFRKNNDISVFNPSAHYNSLTTLQALTNWIIHLISQDKYESGPFVIGASDPMTISELVQSIKIHFPSYSGGLKINETMSSNCYLIDNQKAVQNGYEPPTAASAISWYLDQEGLRCHA